MKRLVLLLACLTGLWACGPKSGSSTPQIAFESTEVCVDSLGLKIEALQDGLYHIYGQQADRQLQMPLYLPGADKKTYRLELRFQDNCPIVENSRDNQALSAFNHLLYTRGRDYWTEGRNWSDQQLLDYLKGYPASADSLIERYRCAKPVSEYLRLWAYLQTFNDYDALPHATGRRTSSLPFTLSDLLESPTRVLNSPMAPYFSLSSYMMYRCLPAGGYEERIAYLEANYTDAGLREKVVAMLQKTRVATKGTPFPAEAVIVDENGETVDMARFRGKYVYVDFWASWCGPCVKEAPYLQQLEKEVNNPDVVFVSISLDKTEAPWKAKREALGLHGFQFLNADNKAADALNISGIPYFAVFDKEGKLYFPNAPRPSQSGTKEWLESLH